MENTRLAEARVLAESLLESLETRSEPISQTLLKAKRVAQLLKDSEAQTWLTYEIKGYPDDFHGSQIGYCIKYLKVGRLSPDRTYRVASLPQLESEISAIEQQIRAIQLPTNGLEFGYINLWMQSFQDKLAEEVRILEASKAALHDFATDCQISLRFGDVSNGIFERCRAEVDSFVRVACPKATEQLLAAFDRLAVGDAEARAQCLASCRRVLLTVADAVFPVRDQEYVDTAGKKRKVGADEYKNRLLAFLDQAARSGSNLVLLTSEIEHLAARLDAIYAKVSKGVHAEVSGSEAELAVIHTYLFLAEVARVSRLTPPRSE